MNLLQLHHNHSYNNRNNFDKMEVFNERNNLERKLVINGKLFFIFHKLLDNDLLMNINK